MSALRPLAVIAVLCAALAGSLRSSEATPGRSADFVVQDPAELWQFTDAGLEAGLWEVVRKLGLAGAADAGRLAVVVADITDLDAPRVASINGDEMMYAASLPKIAILLGAFDKSHRQGVPIPPDVAADVEDMIRYSGNTSATRVLAWVGREELLELLQSPGLRLYDPAHNGGLWVGKDYASRNAFHRDPLHNLSHGATAMQVARFFYLLETGQLVDRERSLQMKAILGDPGIHHKFVEGLEARPGARIFRKSGTWKRFHADGALVESGGHTLILVALAEDPRGGEWLSSLAVPLHDLVVGSPTAEADGSGRQVTAPPH